MKVEEIAEAIAKLPPDQLARFRRWFTAFEAGRVESFARCPTTMGQILIEHFHGAATRVAVSDTAFPHRAEGYNFIVISEWTERANTDRSIAWARQSYAQMELFFASGRYVNYLGDDETGDPVAMAYGPNYRRLQELKSKYDPNNFFT